MAYSPTDATATQVGAEPLSYRVQFTTAEDGVATETTIVNVPVTGRIVRVKHITSSGSGADRTAVIGTVTTPVDDEIVYQATTTVVATVIDDVPDGGAPYYSSTGTLYFQSIYDAGSDNVSIVEILIADGWLQ